jgi:hypothetical protein
MLATSPTFASMFPTTNARGRHRRAPRARGGVRVEGHGNEADVRAVRRRPTVVPR